MKANKPKLNKIQSFLPILVCVFSSSYLPRIKRRIPPLPFGENREKVQIVKVGLSRQVYHPSRVDDICLKEKECSFVTAIHTFPWILQSEECFIVKEDRIQSALLWVALHKK